MFLIFFQFFWERPSPGQVETALSMKFFYLFFGPVWLEIKPELCLLIF